MKIDTMRRIDYWLGIPIVFLLSLVKFLLPKKSKTVRNILLIELSEMGSVILANPMMEKLKQQFDSQLFFVIFKKNSKSLGLLKTIPAANIFTMSDDSLAALLADCIKFIFWTRKNKIDTVFDLELFSRFTAILSTFSGARNRVGFYRYAMEGLYRGNLLTHKTSYNPYQHIAKNFIALVNTLSTPTEQQPNSKTLVAEEEIRLPVVKPQQADKDEIYHAIEKIAPWFKPHQHRIILINANAGDMLPQRRWPQEHYVSLIEKLLDLADNNIIVLTGSAAEHTQAEQLRQRVNHPRCLNCANLFAFEALPTLYSVAALMVTNDSGPGHFSAITTLYTYVLFGPETPQLYGPLGKNSRSISMGLACSPCISAFNHRKTPCSDNQCMKLLQPEQVLQRILQDWSAICKTDTAMDVS